MKNEENKNIKSSRYIQRQADDKVLQFWASAVCKDDTYGIVATNLPVKENDEGNFVPQRCEAEHYGVALNAARILAETKGYKLMTMKVIIDYTEQKSNIVLLYEVTPQKKDNRWVYDMEKVACYKGGFPQKVFTSSLAQKQLDAFGIDPKTFIGVKSAVVQPTENKNRKRLKEAIASLSTIWPDNNKATEE